jgi:broad specificity phosphatase PhoE
LTRKFGESYAMVAERARRWLHDSSAIREKTVVAHGEFGRVLRGLYLGMCSEEMFALDVPRDVVFRLSAGTIERIGARPLAAIRRTIVLDSCYGGLHAARYSRVESGRRGSGQ